MSTLNDLVSALGNLKPAELVALTKQLEEQWGVSAKPQTVQAPQQAVEQAPTKDEWTVVLASVPADKKMNVIKMVREVMTLGLKESKDLVESAPKTLKESVSKEEADAIVAKLTEAGAVIEVK